MGTRIIPEYYREYFNGKGKCLDLGCGIGQYSKELMDYGYIVTSADGRSKSSELVKGAPSL
mgnify:CR=1 FL=1